MSELPGGILAGKRDVSLVDVDIVFRQYVLKFRRLVKVCIDAFAAVGVKDHVTTRRGGGSIVGDNNIVRIRWAKSEPIKKHV